jgi:hypothetical protein
MEPDDYYEPDAEECAWMIAQEKAIASLRSGYHEADNELCNYPGHTDRQLRGYSKEKKRAALRLARAHEFDVVSDCFEIEIAGYDPPPTRKDKRRAKTERRKRNLRIWRTQWEKSCAASVVRKTGALVSAVAA